MKSALNYAIIVVALLLAPVAQATTVPFTENFVSDSANWRDAGGGASLPWVSSGGPDNSGYASSEFSFASSSDGDTTTIFRAQDEFGSSDGNFEGDWVADGVTQFSAFVRHDAPVPLTFFSRFSGPANFPGAVAVNFAPVLPNTWTEIVIAIDASNPQFVSFEGQNFNTVFSASPLNGFAGIGHVQLGVSVGTSIAGNPGTFSFDVDQVSIVPEPASLALLALGGIAILRRRA